MKKLMIGVAVLAVIVVGGLVLVWSNLDGIVKTSIQRYGSEATKTAVSVADVKLQLKAGQATILGLKVANPAGFTDPNIFELGDISSTIDISTIRENPIVINEVRISAPTVVYEINKSGVSNVDMLKKNLAGGGGQAGSSGGGDALKMIIHSLIVEGGKAKVRIAALGDAQQTVNLPRIHLKDIGKKSGGATATEVAQILSSKLLGNVKGSVTSLGVGKYLGKSADMFKHGATSAAGSAVKGLFGK